MWSRGRIQTLLPPAAVGTAAVLGALAAYKPSYALVITLMLAIGVVFVHIRHPARVVLRVLPLLPVLNWLIYDRVGTGAALASLGFMLIIAAACVLTPARSEGFTGSTRSS